MFWLFVIRLLDSGLVVRVGADAAGPSRENCKDTSAFSHIERLTLDTHTETVCVCVCDLMVIAA